MKARYHVLARWFRSIAEADRLRRLLRDSVRDLAHYLRQMSGVEIHVLDALPAGDNQFAILC